MLLTVILALIILSSSLLLHYFQHFKILCTKPKIQRRKSHDGIPTSSPKSPPSRLSIIHQSPPRKNRCNCTLATRDGQTFDFFPAAFFYYLLFQIILCLLIIIIDIITYSSIPSNNKSFFNLLFEYKITKYHEMHHVIDSLFTYNHHMHITNFNDLHPYEILLNITDYILCYSVFLLLLWESLFSWYKYYTTMFVVLYCKIASTKLITMKFMLYAIPFFILFNLQIHFYFILFPILLILHFGFNAYCTWKFSNILIKKYISFISIDVMQSRFENQENINILNSVYFMRRTSLICTIVQTMNLGLFLISYNSITIYYLPIFWSISGSVYTINFIRNRKFINFKIFQCKQKCKSFLNQHIQSQKRIQSKNPIKTNQSKVFVNSNSEFAIDTKMAEMNANISVNTDMTIASNESGANTINTYTTSSHVSNEQYSYNINDNLPSLIPTIGATTSPSIPLPIPPKTNKALKILGISPTKTKSISSKKSVPINIMVQSNSDFRCRSMSISEENNYVSPTKLNALKKDIKMSQSDITNENKSKRNQFAMPIDINKDQKQHENNNVNVDVNVDKIEYIDDEDSGSEDDDFEYVYMDYKPTKFSNINVDSIVENDDELSLHIDNSTPLPVSVKQNDNLKLNKPPIELKHHRSNSAPDTRKSSEHFGPEVMRSLDLFANYGFCSRNSVNSLYQLTKYQLKMNKSIV